MIKWSGDAISAVKLVEKEVLLAWVGRRQLVRLALPLICISCCKYLGPSWNNHCLLFTHSQRGVCLNTNSCPWASQSRFELGMGEM